MTQDADMDDAKAVDTEAVDSNDADTDTDSDALGALRRFKRRWKRS